ncbi:MAG: isoprenylcysteine carboxylmethyltransferase family protein [Betaproteobacteria bacterium]|nr:isoprenylcysteine carboxylmethyltransferase family protein [Betaproteobacteria bacterium]
MLRTRIPPPLYALLAGITMFALNRYAPGAMLLGPPLTRWAWLIATPGGLLAGWAATTFRRAHTTLDPTDPSKASRLVTHGPFRFSRNPMYLGLLIALSGWAAWLGSLSPLLVLPFFVALVTSQQIVPEEQALQARFGEPYTRYRQRVRRWVGGGRTAR